MTCNWHIFQWTFWEFSSRRIFKWKKKIEKSDLNRVCSKMASQKIKQFLKSFPLNCTMSSSFHDLSLVMYDSMTKVFEWRYLNNKLFGSSHHAEFHRYTLQKSLLHCGSSAIHATSKMKLYVTALTIWMRLERTKWTARKCTTLYAAEIVELPRLSISYKLFLMLV